MNKYQDRIHYVSTLCSSCYAKSFWLSQEEIIAIKKEMLHYEDFRSVSIEALKIVQEHRGWVSDIAVEAIARILGVPASDIEEIATFYNQIFRCPVGKNIIRYCDSIVCYITGYQKIQIALEKELNISPGQTTSDGKFTLLPTCCLGKCDKSPVIMVNKDMYVCFTIEEIHELLGQYK